MRLAVPLLALAWASAQAQTPRWATLAPGVGASVPVAGGFGDPWRTQPGLRVRLDVPAYGGTARSEVWAAVVDVEEEGGAVPEFVLAVPTLGWGPHAEVGRLRLGGGVRVGAALFRFDDRAEGNFQNETEIAVGAWGGAAVHLGARVEAWAEADVARIALADPTTLTGVAFGVAIRLDTPGWLRDVLE